MTGRPPTRTAAASGSLRGARSRQPGPTSRATAWRDDPRALRPMLAVLADAPIRDERLAYEPKYDGIRALAAVEAGKARFWSRLGNEKTSQFPEIAQELGRLGRKWRRPVVLDGEIVALDRSGRPLGFQHLQGRIHLIRASDIKRVAGAQPVAYFVFDLLRSGDEDLRSLSFLDRRRRLEQLLGRPRAGIVRITEMAIGDARPLLRRAEQEEWEGLIAKDVRSTYETARRSPAWRKLKVVRRQEFVIGGWTEPRQTRQYFGSLLLGVYPPSSTPNPQSLIYVGGVGTGFTEAELERLAGMLRARRSDTCPFASPPGTLERAHWIRPELVAEVRFSEWTADGKLRAPVYLGLRDDVRPESVGREPTAATAFRHQDQQAQRSRANGPSPSPTLEREVVPGRPELAKLVARLQELEDARRDGFVELPDGHRLKVTNLRKVFWPGQDLTKGDLMRYYVRVAPFLLPAVLDRPLVMKRFPNGIEGKAFYQQRAPDDVPRGVRVEQTADGAELLPRLIGGSLLTLLYMTQLAAISQDPWFSRVQTAEYADYVALDLDPQPGVDFGRVLDVARWIGEVLDRLGTPSVPKTSGSRGLHIYIPLPPKSTYESGMLFCQIVATFVASKHPRVATVERVVAARGRTVYVDYLQNIRGKTLATAYSARATDFAGISTPVAWQEIEEGIEPRDFTLATIDARLRAVGDLWSRLRTSKPADLRAAFRLEGR